MSKDLRLKHRCTHHVQEEWLTIAADRRTLRPVRYPSNSTVKVLWNRKNVPEDGLWSPIEVRGSKSEPFTLDASNNTLIFILPDTTLTIQLPKGKKVKAADVVKAINAAKSDLASQDRGRIVLSYNGISSSFLRMGGGTGHSTLGFAPLKKYSPRSIITGWELLADTTSIDPAARIIRFKDMLSAEDDVFEVSYYTVRGVCRRCQGLGIENDLRHDTQGNVVLVENQSLMLQEVEKILFTIKGSNLFHRWYGTSLSKMIGSKVLGTAYVETQLVKEISDALEKYRQIKEQQSKYQPVTRKEQLRRVVSVSVKQDQFDPTTFNVAITLESQSGELEQFSDTLAINDITANGFQLVQ